MSRLTLGRNAWIGMGLGTTAGAALVVFLIYKQTKRRRAQTLFQNQSSEHVLNSMDGPSTDIVGTQVHDVQVCDSIPNLTVPSSGVMVVEVDPGLLPEQQVELRNRLDEVLQCVANLREEVADLRGGLQGIAGQIVQDVKTGIEESQKAARRRRHFLPRERTDSVSSSSIYFTASGASLYDGESEGGYTTANPESDYNGDTDRDTDRETDKEPERDTEDEDDESCATVQTLKQDEQSLGDDDEDEEEEEEEEPSLQLDMEVLTEELALLLSQSDALHAGGSQQKEEGFQMLSSNKPLYGENKEFQWRLARAYNDMYEVTEDTEQRKLYAEQGRDEAEAALQMDDLSAECHKWFAVLTGLTSHYEGIHGKLKSSHIFKEHIDKAISLKADDPLCFYLLGRWCYQVSSMGWLEKKAATALYESPPTATLLDALENFLKAEELSPGFSRAARLYIAKCHKDLGNISEARTWAELAFKMPKITNEDGEASSLEEELEPLRN
ncbi:regulator of microtubule dynamics protein 3-like [Conger conger]|uniref:regulator of microtubule dynamics protein 3-like n=1 Tax=Conger conger TaxID=82655 RepID=UPI002A5A5B39|nr:regulator of microtubule dynamics protein 3-like [Conger conger]